MSDLEIRSAMRRDAADLAILDNLAGHGIPMIFWKELTTNDRNEDAVAVGRDRIADDNSFYNWKKARVSVDNDLILGMATSYIMPPANTDDADSEALKRSTKAFKPVFELYDLCAHHWFIDALAVYPCAQGRGIGRRLFDDSIALGQKSEAQTMSLIVEDTNEIAYALYRSYGFEVTDQRDFVPFKGALEINEWLLMSRTLS